MSPLIDADNKDQQTYVGRIQQNGAKSATQTQPKSKVIPFPKDRDSLTRKSAAPDSVDDIVGELLIGDGARM